MQKRFLSLLCVLALCLGLLPVTALAVAPIGQVLYVGGVKISSTGYWTTDSDGNVTASTAGETPTDNYISYDAENNVLTLHNATIKKGLEYSENIEGGTYIFGSAIGVLNQNGAAELTITLEGTNTIAEVGKGIFVLASSTSTGGATLTITGGGSLNASASQTGIWVQSNGNNAALCVENAEVTASPDGAVKNGVLVQAKDGSDVSLTVNGGSLTASVNANIWFQFGSSASGSGTPTVTVSNNAIVRANGGIANNSSTSIQYGTGNKENGGIVWNGTGGTVYGNVTLQKDLTIGEGETLTVPDGSSLNCNEKLTNSGTILASGGTVTGNLSGGTAVTTPNITAQPTGQTVTEGSAATFSVTASAGDSETLTYQWQQSTDNGSSWTNIESGTSASYTINSTNTSMNGYQYRCVVTGSGGVSVISQTATLTVQAKPASVPVTGVTLDKTTLELFTGGSATLTATVQPDDATNKNVTWQSDNANVATVQNGTVNAVGAGEATITVTTEDGEKTATCKVIVTQSEHSISANTTALDFGSVYTGYTQPAAKTVTITNDGNQTLTLNQPASTVSFEVGTLTKTQLAAGEKATFTVQPKAGLAVGTYSENFTVSGDGGATVTITANFTVQRYSSGGGTPTKTPSQQAVDKIESAKDGSTVEIKLSTGSTKLDKEVFEELAGRDVTLEISLPGGVSWTVNGQDIPENADLTDLDLGVSMNTSTIPVSLINSVTGEVGTVQFTLKHNGEFGFTMTLTAPVGVKNAGLWANLYHYDEDAGKMVYQTAALVDEDGNVALPFDHASQYAIVIDEKSHELPFADVSEGAWYESAVRYVYTHGIMSGYGDKLFGPDDDLSRAQLCQIVYNMEGQPTVSGDSAFTDVADGAWYADAVSWAAENGIVGGYGDGKYGPDDPITREQLAAILYRYAQNKGYDVSVGEDTNILSYTDAFDVAEYAIPAMQWACGAGVIEGVTESTLEPQGNATRAQVATMLQRFCENIAQ